MDAPIIGIPCRRSYDVADEIFVQGIAGTYVESVDRAGGIPLLIPLIGHRVEEVRRLVALCDGLLFPGGEDIEPWRYGVERCPMVKTVAPDRDCLELEAFHYAWQLEKPILGICRGLQIINVALGGTLVQDISSERDSSIVHGGPDEKWVEIVHDISITPNSELARLLKADVLPVNSLHHQCIDRPAAGLTISAVSPVDNIIEAVEISSSDRWLVAVQWHPEVLWNVQSRETQDLSWNLYLFKELVRRAALKKERLVKRSKTPHYAEKT